MERLYIDLGKESYYIEFESSYINRLKNYADNKSQTLIITDSNIDMLYGDVLLELGATGVHKYVIPAGEATKNITTATKIIEYLLDNKFSRRSRIIAFGGGMVGDIAGFVASIYMRGIDFIQFPTTLLAQVDSSVGGKTGINFLQGKNMIGTFYQPKEVVIAPELLRTLPKNQITSGLGEIIKYGIIYDYSFLQYIYDNLQAIYDLDIEVLKRVIRDCCRIKADIVSKDEKEEGVRILLNFGHTVGHGLEALTQYEVYTHGEAVLVGMYHEAAIAKVLELIDVRYFNEIEEIIKATGISYDISMYSRDKLLNLMSGDKKNKEGKISFVLPISRGKMKEVLLTQEELTDLL